MRTLANAHVERGKHLRAAQATIWGALDQPCGSRVVRCRSVRQLSVTAASSSLANLVDHLEAPEDHGPEPRPQAPGGVLRPPVRAGQDETGPLAHRLSVS